MSASRIVEVGIVQSDSRWRQPLPGEPGAIPAPGLSAQPPQPDPGARRHRLLNVAAVLTAVLSLGAVIGVVACGPPPPPATVLPGNPHFTGRQNDGVLHGDGEVGEPPDPDALLATGWWIRADGAALYPPATTVPEGAGEPYRPEGQSR